MPCLFLTKKGTFFIFPFLFFLFPADQAVQHLLIGIINDMRRHPFHINAGYAFRAMSESLADDRCIHPAGFRQRRPCMACHVSRQRLRDTQFFAYQLQMPVQPSQRAFLVKLPFPPLVLPEERKTYSLSGLPCFSIKRFTSETIFTCNAAPVLLRL